MKDKTTVGVVIGRFQAPDLHDGHTYLIDKVMEKHEDVLVFLGTTKVKLSCPDPLDFQTRKLMIQAMFPSVTILQLNDMPRRNDLWSIQVDEKIKVAFDGKPAILYGSRDSFIPSYGGIHKTEFIETIIASPCGTDLRVAAAKEPIASSDFRKGVIYNVYNKYPIVFPTVDVAILNDDETNILLGRKPADPEGVYRFIGGFVDNADDNELQAVRREAFEETCAEVEPYEFIGSMAVRNDPRYKRQPDLSIMTHFYKARYVSGLVKGSDDIAEVKWCKIADLTPEQFVPEHQPLLIMLKNNLEKTKALVL